LVTEPIKVEEAEATVIPSLNIAPFFVETLPVSLVAFVGDKWSYTLPDTLDPEESEVKVTAELGVAMLFMNFDTDTFSIAEGVTLEYMVSKCTLKVVLKDAQLA
jgi:hypothetical protein